MVRFARTSDETLDRFADSLWLNDGLAVTSQRADQVGGLSPGRLEHQCLSASEVKASA